MKRKRSKKASILAFSQQHPTLGPTEIAAKLTRDGTAVTANYVSNVLSTARAVDKSQRLPRPRRKAAAGGLMYGVILRAKELSDSLGGIEPAKIALDTLQALGVA